MKLITTLLALLNPPADAAIVEHVEVKPACNVAKKKLDRARRKAAERHGKPFHTHERKARETEPSPTLKALNELTTPTPVIVLTTPRLVAKK